MTPQELADRLIGTCDTVDVTALLETVKECGQFDALAFECEGCGWWCNTDELNNDRGKQLCDECEAESA